MQMMTYRQILEEEFSFRTKENQAYSLRAFARDLDISPSQLSEVLSGKVGIGKKKAIKVAASLGLNESEKELFVALVEIEHGRNQKTIEQAKKLIRQKVYGDNFKGLSLDGFKIISDWHYFAILSCMELDTYDGTTLYLARKLNLELSIVEESVKRLLKMDMIDLKEGKFVPTLEMFSTTHNISSNAIKKFHKQHITKSLKAIDSVSVELRDITSMTMAIDIKKLPEAKEKIKKFRRELSEYLESGEKTDVYNINIQLIPLNIGDV